MHELTVDLNAPPRERWQLSKPMRRGAVALLDVYKRDMGLSSQQLGFLEELGDAVLPQEHAEEILGISERLGVPFSDALLGNLYYDALKFLWGCTAFAVDAPNGVLHARNLDWWTKNNLLSTETLITRFRNGPCGDFLTVGWPGFVGALSGVATGRFAITLNSVLSDDAAAVQLPVVSLIRTVLQTEPDFEAAVKTLSETPVASDSILVVSGVDAAERVVIERTPKRFSLRRSPSAALCATNDYRVLDRVETLSSSSLSETSCDRYDRISKLVERRPSTLSACIDYLSDERVRMGITAQQMAFNAKTGEVLVEIPGDRLEARVEDS